MTDANVTENQETQGLDFAAPYQLSYHLPNHYTLKDVKALNAKNRLLMEGLLPGEHLRSQPSRKFPDHTHYFLDRMFENTEKANAYLASDNRKQAGANVKEAFNEEIKDVQIRLDGKLLT